MSQTAVVIGLGELGSLFAQGLLRTGRSVVPIMRGVRPENVARAHPAPEIVLVAVAEPDLASVLDDLPAAWRRRVGLLQNELVPRAWHAHGIESPTVAVVWFEKKPGRLVRELLPTIIQGPNAALLAAALQALGLHTQLVESESELVRALVEKNVYILTTNIAGLEAGKTVRELWQQHRALGEAVARDVIELEQALTGARLPQAELIAAFERAIHADPEHASTGRSAPARLERALRSADSLGLSVPTLRRIAAERS